MSHADWAGRLVHPVVFEPPHRLTEPDSWIGHIPFAFWLVEALRPRVLVELGTYTGNSYFAFCQAVSSLNLPSACYAVDTWEGDPQTGFYGDAVYAAVAAYHSRYESFSRLVRSSFDDALGSFPDGTIDLLHIDGVHTYSAVRHDFETWFPKLSDRAVVLLHDTNVRRKDFGVAILWRELFSRYPGFEFLHSQGLGVLTPGPAPPEPLRWLTDASGHPQLTACVRLFFERIAAGHVGRLRCETLDLENSRLRREIEASSIPPSGPSEEQLAAARRLGEERTRELDRARVELEQARSGRERYFRKAGALRTLLHQEKTASLVLQERLASEKIRVADLLSSASWRWATPLRSAWSALERARTALRPAAAASAQPPSSARQLIEASRLFDAAYYLRIYPDVAALAIDPLDHFLSKGMWEGRDPHLLFRTEYYRRQAPEAVAAGMSHLEHFLRIGAGEKRNPHPLFDCAFYLRHAPGAAVSGLNPLTHFLLSGGLEGLPPHPLFDSAYYLKTNPDVASSRINPLVHFLTRGYAERRNPHPLFDVAWFLDRYPEFQAPGAEDFIQFVTDGPAAAEDPHPLFDSAWYLSQCPDAAAAGMTPLEHYLRFGKARKLNPHPLFNTAYYLATYPAVADAPVDPLVDFILRGNSERRNPSPAFDTAGYLRRHPAVEASGVNALRHFVMSHAPSAASLDHAGDAPLGPRGRPVSVARQIADAGGLAESDAAVRVAAGKIRFAAHDSPEASIVIPVFNQLPLTLRALLALLRNIAESPYEVIVVDDCSTDETSAVLSAIPGLRYIRNQTNQGFLKSANAGAAQARGDFIVLLNNDTVPLPGWLTELIATLRRWPAAGMAGSMLLYPDGRLQEAGGVIWADGSGWNLGRGRNPEAPEFCYAREVDYCSGASLAIWRSLWNTLGGFDTSFAPAYYEDTDLAFRVRQAGYKVVYQPASRLVHFEGASCGVDITAGVKKYQEVNRARFFDRWKHVIAGFGLPDTAGGFYRERYASRQVLVVDACTPTPDRDSGSNDTWHYLLLLREAGCRVAFLPAHNMAHWGNYTADLQRRGVECLYAPFVASVEHFLEREGARFDVVILFRENVASALIDRVRQKCPNARVVFHTVDLHFLREQRQAAQSGDAATAISAERTRARELATIRQSDFSIVVSDVERELLGKLAPDAMVELIPLARDFPGRRRGFAGRRDIVFLGGFAHPPNVDAVRFFVQSVWPLILKQLPDCRFLIAGSSPGPEVQAFAGESVRVVGYVPNLGDVFNACRLSVAPLRFGAGMKGKVVTSLGYGVPCVCTTVAVEGMGLTDGRDVLVADAPQAFADAVVRAYTSEALWQTLSDQGLAAARESFSIDRLRADLLRLLERLPQSAPRVMEQSHGS